MATALRSRLAIGLLVGAALLPAPAAFSRDQTSFLTGRGTGTVAVQPPRIHSTGPSGAPLLLPGFPVDSPRRPAVPDDDRSGPYAGRRAGEGRQKPGRFPEPEPEPPGPSAHDEPPWAPRPSHPGAEDPDGPREPSTPPGPRHPSGAPSEAPTRGAPRPPADAPRPPPASSAGPTERPPDSDDSELQGAWRPPLPYEPEPPEPDEPEWTDVGVPPVDPSADETPADGTTAGDDRGGQSAHPTGRMLRVLPIGTGLALMGLGLAYIGIRLRKR
ncbi:hypothetical protein [Streptomyces sp. NPDC051776]|uniref:hypothetical protein n=1 Tax=Streptomyces sp. NPDC051776 TaxID=3155414 RepID=UPI0034346616